MTTTPSPPKMSTDSEILARLRKALKGEYAVERELTSGGMAFVFLARDLKHSRQVVIKVLKPDLANSVGAERFLREIQTTAVLRHPNIVPLYNSGNADGLLFYIMPYIGGGSLRDKLDREKQLSLEESVTLTRSITNALDYAHTRGIIHRDIKPDNVLIGDDGTPMVSDFGLARALFEASSHKLTATGLVVGTPFYISPEQADESRTIDPRADIYSLGCVVFELLAGEPPFHGKTHQAVINRHLLDERPSLRSRGVTVPQSVEGAVARAMARVPAERFKTAGEFAAALEGGAQASRRWSWFEQWRRGWKAAAVATVLAVIAVALSESRSHIVRDAFMTLRTPPADTTKYIVLPFRHGRGVPDDFNEEQVLHDALARWSGIAVVDQFQVADQAARLDTAHLGLDDASYIARKLGAGRFVWGTASRVADSIRIRATLYDAARNGAQLNDSTISVAANATLLETPLRALADALLFRGANRSRRAQTATGTRSVPARQAFLRAQLALESSDLAGADSALAAAVRYDPQYAVANLWLAQVRGWRSDDRPQWQELAQRAYSLRAQLPALDRALAVALWNLSRNDFPRACGEYRSILRNDPEEFAAWFGLGECQRLDDLVIPNNRSLSGWAFRSSYASAANAYATAFRVFPSISKAFRNTAFGRIRTLLFTGSGVLRPGRSAEGRQFGAFAAWRDTLAFTPFLLSDINRGRREALPTSTGEAARRQREAFRDLTVSWRASLPDSPDALEALAISLDELSMPAAIDSMRKVRALTQDSLQRQRIAMREVWALIRAGLPDGTQELSRARALADSTVKQQRATPPAVPGFAAVAVVSGNLEIARAALQNSRQSSAAIFQLPRAVADLGDELVIEAAHAQSAAAIRARIAKLEDAIQNSIPLQEQAGVRGTLFLRPAMVAFPLLDLRAFPAFPHNNYPFLSAQEAYLRGDTAAVSARFREVGQQRKFTRPADLTFDALVPETWLLWKTAAPSAARAWLSPTLAGIRFSSPEVFFDPVNAEMLRQAVHLRIDLAKAERDTTELLRWDRARAALGW